MDNGSIDLPDYAEELFKPYRYKVLYGGRGSAKSYSAARALLLIGAMKPIKVLCARELQSSINDSVHSLLRSQAQELGLLSEYSITEKSIKGKNGTEFLFKGVRHNVESIKSIPKIDVLWLEEADSVSQESWDVLIPTVRDEGSEIWVTYNPQRATDPTHGKFVNTLSPPDDAFIKKVSWRDNPWFPEVLKKEKDYLFRVDPNLAQHIWEGECRTNSDAQVFKDKWEYRSFDVLPEFDGPYFGADWGFSTDPTTLIKMYIHGRTLYVREERYKIGVELDDLPEFFNIPEARSTIIRADNARPETISHVARRGFNIVAAKKWAGSVEDGVEFLRSFEKIIIHTDCPHTKDEFSNYSYKIDRLTGAVTTTIVDKHNHAIDAIRYGLEPMISRDGLSMLDVL